MICEGWDYVKQNGDTAGAIREIMPCFLVVFAALLCKMTNVKKILHLVL